MIKKSKYSKFFLYITFILSFTILSLSSYHYYYFSKIIIEKEYKSQVRELELASNNYKMVIKLAQLKAIQIYRDLNTSQLLFNKDMDVYDRMRIKSQLNLYVTSTPCLKSIYFYDYDNNRYNVRDSGLYECKRDGFYDTYINKLLINWSNTYILRPISRIITMPDGKKEPVYSIIFAQHTTNRIQKYAIILNLSVNQIMDEVKSTNQKPNTDEFIVNDKKELLTLKLDDYRFLDDLSKEDYIDRIFDEEQERGYLISKIDGVDNVVSYYRNPNYNWIYISRTPISYILSNIMHHRSRTLTITLICLVFGILISTFLSKRFKMIMERLGQQVDNLKRETKQNLSSINYNRLKESLRLKSADEKDCNLLTLVQPDFSRDDNIIAIHVSIDNLEKLKQEITMDDIELYQFILQNVGEEMLEGKVQSLLSIQLWSDGVVFIVSIDVISYDNILTPILKNYQKWIEQNIGITISCGISTYGHISDLHLLVNQAKQMIEYRLISGPSCCNYYRITSEISTEWEDITTELEEKLFLSIRRGKKEDAIKILDRINNNFDLPPSTVLYTYNQVAFILSNVIKKLDSTYDIHITFNLKDVINKINSMEYWYQIRDYFNDLIEDYCDIIISHNKNKNNKTNIVDKVNKIISEHYDNPDLSIQEIADKLELSVNHLSRIYKQQMGLTILQSLVEYRMKIARQLLLNSEDNVSIISEKVGFSSSSYFYKVFKKYNGVTPIEYRQNH